MSKFSIVVPIYNSEKYLNKCIESILAQTFKEFELILVNDGSNDKSLEICRKYERKDSRVRVINKDNEGTILTRIKGVKESNCEYITFVDSDDWIDKNTLEIVNYSIKVDNPDVVVFNMYKVLDKLSLIKRKGNTEYFEKYSIVEGKDIKEKLTSAYFHGDPFPSNLCAKVYRKKYLIDGGKYLKNIRFLGDDLFYNLEVFLNVNKVKLINKPLYYYRAGGNTNKYMPYLFNDIIEGYKVQKEVIEKYYSDSREKRYNGATAMLLNTFKTCLSNIFLSEYDEKKLKNVIKLFLENDELKEASKNEKKRSYFDKDFLDAILYKEVEYLYEVGRRNYEKDKIKRCFKKILV